MLIKMTALGFILLISGCTVSNIKELTYDVLQNERLGQCQQSMRSDCKPRQSYDAYQKERAELKTP